MLRVCCRLCKIDAVPASRCDLDIHLCTKVSVHRVTAKPVFVHDALILIPPSMRLIVDRNKILILEKDLLKS